ncbi:alpha/beta hydrolase [Phormidium sp. LEGE 05292]|uniref:alpha/beta fold hydrolase n=1 Tax=[Phormidium] sp. LEGE 05292 TaxID=767427 RepID=UPI00188162A2|nr:alpha/beta hydrolase [Phormidium sp. LEGE 05292]MBE9224285.1 alpha/beta hydrolase [Phormidium sp. LEGE 05292]
MWPSFIPNSVEQLTESTSIALAQNIQYQPIFTPLSTQPIGTTYVNLGKIGTPILLLHGFDSSVLEFRRLLPILAEKQETWAIDLLGFGFTERNPQLTFSPSAIATHLYYSWKTLIKQPVILVGASMGGAAAIDFALTYPQAVKKLVLIDSAGFTAGPAMGKFLFPPLGYLATSFLRNPQVRQRISINAYCNPNFASADAQLCAALHLQTSGWSQALIAFTKSGGYGSFRQKLKDIGQPTLILWGEADRILGIADAEKFANAIANSKLIWIANCGHVPHLEKPELTAQHIFNFITETDR